MSRIVFISPYRDLSQVVMKISEEINIPLEYYEGVLEDVEPIINSLKGSAPDIFISRGGTATKISRVSNIPVVPMNTGPLDLLECCDEARQFSTHIILTSFGKPFIGTALLEKVLGIAITPLVFHSMPELRRKIEHLVGETDCCVVGGGPSVTYATELGIPSVFLRTNEETVKEALLRAKELADLRQNQKRHSSRLSAILNSVYDGVIAVDQEGKIEIFNGAAENILGLDRTKMEGHLVTETVANTALDQVLKTGKSEIGEIQQIGSVRIVTNRVPIRAGDRVIGAVATFQEVDRVVRLGQNLRKALSGREFRARFRFEDIIGKSKVLVERKELARRFARSDLTVLIYGESGTGKELFAQSIHQASRRFAKPFVAVNCGALPPNLLESELFGYEEGAFTGARKQGKHGLFEMAHGGTLFLDEIDSLSLEFQGRLLRVLQEGEVMRIGGDRVIPVDVRIVAATNTPPNRLLDERRIREDLFYRLNVLYLRIPSLAKRKEDIPLLAEHFLSRSENQHMLTWLPLISPWLMDYSWPGNVRELKNVMDRLTFFESDEEGKSFSPEKMLELVAPHLLAGKDDLIRSPDNLHDQVQQMEIEKIEKSIEQAGGMKKAAKQLGISRATLWRKLKGKQNPT